MARSRTFDLPQLEIDLAKALNAHVVKAWTVVRFSSVDAESRRDWTYQSESYDIAGNKTTMGATDYKATSAAQLGVREYQTHLAVRVATGKPDFKPSFATGGKAPARDGDIVITLVSPIFMNGSEQYLAVENTGAKESGTGRVSRASGLLGGLMGSRGNTAKRKERLAMFDLTPAEIARLHGPIGLDLGGKSPAEIAVAIVAEIVAVKNGVALVQKKEGSALPESSGAAGVCGARS